MLATVLATKVLSDTDRIIVTNLPLRLPEVAEYVHERNEKFDVRTIRNRVTMISDTRILKRFWLTLGNDWWIPDVKKEDWNLGKRLDYREAYRWLPTTGNIGHRKPIPDMYVEEIERYCHPLADGSPGEMERCPIETLPGVQFIIDEIQNIFPSRGFMQTSQGAVFWLSQQRKLGADFIAITQNGDLVDKEFRDLADDWLYITNWGRKQKSFFRLPKIMTWAKYDQRPGPGVSPMVQGTLKANVEKIWNLYDTTAGVGIEGGLVGDTKSQTPGIHWSWAFAAAAVLLILLFQVPGLITKGIQHLVMHSPTAVHAQAVPSPATNFAPQAIQAPPPPTPPKPTTTNAPSTTRSTMPSSTLTGLVVWHDSATAYLSDGSVVSFRDLRRWGGVLRDGSRIVGARIDGQALYLK